MCEGKVLYVELNFTEICSRGSIDNLSLLVQIMAWCLYGNKLLSEPMMTQFTHANMCPQAKNWQNTVVHTMNHRQIVKHPTKFLGQFVMLSKIVKPEPNLTYLFCPARSQWLP